jgi:hypothetical protein
LHTINPVRISAATEIGDLLPVDLDHPGILHFTELNRAKPTVLNALMEIFGESKDSNSGWSLPENWLITATCVPNSSGHNVTSLDAALVQRMLQVTFSYMESEWEDWTEENLPKELKDLLRGARGRLKASTGRSELPDDIQLLLRANPRTLTYLGALYKADMNPELLEKIVRGLLPRGAADEFMDIYRNQD